MKGVNEFRPNDETHKAFGDALRKANQRGVKIIAMDCNVTTEGLTVADEVLVKL